MLPSCCATHMHHATMHQRGHAPMPPWPKRSCTNAAMHSCSHAPMRSSTYPAMHPCTTVACSSCTIVQVRWRAFMIGWRVHPGFAVPPRVSGSWMHCTVLQKGQTDKTKHRKHVSRSDQSLNTRLDLLEIPGLWEAALETERRCFWKVILESNFTHNISRASDSFSTVAPKVNRGDWWCIVRDCGCIVRDWRCIVRDLETVIVLFLLILNFIIRRPYHSLSLPEVTVLGLCNSNSDARGWHKSIKVESSA